MFSVHTKAIRLGQLEGVLIAQFGEYNGHAPTLDSLKLFCLFPSKARVPLLASIFHHGPHQGYVNLDQAGLVNCGSPQ